MKFLVLAALLGVACANKGASDWWSVGQATGQGWVIDGPRQYGNDWFQVNHFAEADFGFGTVYKQSY